MRKNVNEILSIADSLPTKQDRIKFLVDNQSEPLKMVLKYALDPNIKWLLPKGEVPYKKNKEEEFRNVFYSEARKLYLFIEGGNDNLKQNRREYLFIQLLESIDPKDAELLVSVKDKKLPYKNITPNLVKKAFPDLL